MKDHLDPQILAAWLDGSLTDRERSAAEAHAADCDRCRRVLAAMVRTQPPAPSPFGWLSGFSIRWLVPITAVGVAILLWNVAVRPPRVAVPQKDVASGSSPEPGATSSATPSTSPSAAPSTTPSAAPAAPPQTGFAAPQPQRARQVSTQPAAGVARRAEPHRQQRTGPAPEPAAVSESVVAQSPPVATGVPSAAPVPAPPPPSAPAIPPGPVPAPPSAKAAEPRSRAVGGVAGGVVGGVVGGVAADRVQPLAETVQVLTPGERAPGQFVSADGAVIWRIGRAGRIARSGDGGRTWSPQHSGVTVDLLAGSAPAPDVCWVVGRAGSVLLLSGQAGWKRIPFPESVDLVAVSARDGTTASVTTVDGRLFTTSDGGKSWHPAGR